MTGVEKLLKRLNSDQQIFLLKDFPLRLCRYFAGNYNGVTKSKWLALGAQKYSELDSIAVALSYLKPYYPPRPPGVLYRVVSVRRFPTKKVLVVKRGSLANRPLLSWSSRDDPLIYGHKYSDKDIVLVYSPVDPKLLFASPKSLTSILLDISSVIGTKDNYARLALKYMRNLNEREYLLYLSHPIKCTWRKGNDTSKMMNMIKKLMTYEG